MTDRAVPHAATVVAMPADIDYGSADRAYDQLDAALTVGVPVLIADFTLTTYCDCDRAALRHPQHGRGPASGPTPSVVTS